MSLLPQNPLDGPPVPSYMRIRWPWLPNPGTPATNPAVYNTTLDAEMTESRDNPHGQDDYVIVLKKKNPNPIWLKEHQQRLAEASKKATELTKHLTGENKVRARYNLISRILKNA